MDQLSKEQIEEIVYFFLYELFIISNFNMFNVRRDIKFGNDEIDDGLGDRPILGESIHFHDEAFPDKVERILCREKMVADQLLQNRCHAVVPVWMLHLRLVLLQHPLKRDRCSYGALVRFDDRLAEPVAFAVGDDRCGIAYLPQPQGFETRSR